MNEQPKCELCGEPMPPGEEMFKFHGYSGSCPKPPLPAVPRMVRAAIAIDKWKLAIFEQHLYRAGYIYETCAWLTPDTLHLYVNNTLDLTALESVVRAANTEAAEGKP